MPQIQVPKAPSLHSQYFGLPEHCTQTLTGEISPRFWPAKQSWSYKASRDKLMTELVSSWSAHLILGESVQTRVQDSSSELSVVALAGLTGPLCSTCPGPGTRLREDRRGYLPQCLSAAPVFLFPIP